MFYAQFVLAKKGPLAKIWLAAHWEKKLTKAQIYETDVPQAIEEVIRPKVKMALRTVGHLLLGIVRIYSKKTRYLLADTNEVYLKMKVNFRDGFSFEADIPLDPEIDENLGNVDDFNITVPEFLEADYDQKLIMANVSRLEDITLKDDCNFGAHFCLNNAIDDGFGDEEYGVIENIYGSVGPCSLRATPQPESQIEEARAVHSSVLSGVGGDTVILSEATGYRGTPHSSDDFGGPINLKVENQTMPMDSGPQDMFISMIQSSGANDAPAPVFDEPMDVDYPMNDTAVAPEVRAQTPESFALEPLDIDRMEENNRRKRNRKARKLLVDTETMISNEAFRNQQNDYDDILQTVAVAPPSRQMLKLCVSGELVNLMNMPAQALRNRELLQEYRNCLVTRPFDPNFTMMEMSDSSSCASMDRPSAPWEDLELNDLRPDQLGPGPADDDFFDDIDMGIDLAREPMEFAREFELDNDFSARVDPTPQPNSYGENKENEEEDWSDPFGSSVSSRGRLEAYGFGNGTAHKTVDEDGKWSKRASHILKKVSTDIKTSGFADFSAITASAKTRKHAAEQFYSLLTLVKSQTITVEQVEPYGEIVIRAGEHFNKDPETPKAAAETSIRTPMRTM